MTDVATYHGIRVPAVATLAKYGLTIAAWKRILTAQRYGCGVCKRQAPELPVPKRGGVPFLAVDHEHVKGWAEMVRKNDPVRLKYVRGLCCTRCNHFVLTRYATPELHRLAADYLDRYAGRPGAY